MPSSSRFRTHCDCFRRNWVPGKIHCEQTWYAASGPSHWEALGLIFGIARQGCTVIVPYREEMAKRHLKVSGDLGRVIFMVGIRSRTQVRSWLIIVFQECDLRNTPSIEESVRHSDVVYNLIGRVYPTKYVDMAQQ